MSMNCISMQLALRHSQETSVIYNNRPYRNNIAVLKILLSSMTVKKNVSLRWNLQKHAINVSVLHGFDQSNYLITNDI